MRGKTKRQILDQMMRIGGARPLFADHAWLLLSSFGQAQMCREMGITDTHACHAAGDGSFGMLRLLAEESLGFKLHSDLGKKDYSELLMLERERFRRGGLEAASGREAALPLCLRKDRRGWVASHENFADFLCESRKLLRQLLGVGRRSLRAKPASGWAREGDPRRALARRRRTKGPPWGRPCKN